MEKKHVAVIGAGPGGLTAAMLLAAKGLKVSVFEREERVGGRNRAIVLGDYIFDTGPTFLMMLSILELAFEESGCNIRDYLELTELDPMYQLSFEDKTLFPTRDKNKMREQLKKVFPGDEKGLDLFHQKEKIRYDKMYPCLQKPYGNLASFFNPTILKAYPYLSLGKSLYGTLANYFKHEFCRLAFTFQAKYLGMSPWECPAAFTIIPYIEHQFGVFHVTGGLSRISEVMADVVKESGGEIHLNTRVEKILTENGEAKGVKLENGETVITDAVVVNADFGHAAATLFEPGILKKWHKDKLAKKKYSCSTFMLYLGVDKLYQEAHHNIIFAEDYKANIDDIAVNKVLSDDMSVYVRNASITDKTLAPEGHSALYVLVPVPNNSSGVQWDESTTAAFRRKVMDRIISRTSMKDLDTHIKEELVITPSDWEYQQNIFLGATFNLGHQLTQMLYLRPHNRFEECARCYLVGGGTHPGSGLPTIYESARISSKLLMEDLGIVS